jgi:hypothetical protein
MNVVHYFDVITLAEWPRDAIYRRLGYRKASTRMTAKRQVETERQIKEALDLIHLQGAVLRLPIRIEQPDRVILPEDLVFTSKNLATFLRDVHEIVLMGATAGDEIMAAIQKDTARDQVAKGVVMDATASEIVDAALDWIMAYLNQGLRREGKLLMKTRYSAGYGDFALENQRAIHRLLAMERLGVSLTDTCILVPEKSVTAVTGVIAME